MKLVKKKNSSSWNEIKNKYGLELVDEEDKCGLEEKVEDDPAIKKRHFPEGQNVSPDSERWNFLSIF